MVATYEQNQHPYGGVQEYDGENFESLLRDIRERVSVAHHLDDPALPPLLKGLVEERARPLAETETRFAAGSVVFGGAAYNHRLEPWQPYATRHAGSVRAHLVCGVRTGVVAAVEVSATDINCSPFLPKLLQTTAEHFPRAQELAAGRAYLSRRNFQAAWELGVDLYIPFKPNSRPSGHHGRRRCWAWDEALRRYRHDHEEFMERYHRSHSIIEDVADTIEDRTGTCLHAKTEPGRFNEVLLKVLAHNTCVLAEAEEDRLLDEQVAAPWADAHPIA